VDVGEGGWKRRGRVAFPLLLICKRTTATVIYEVRTLEWLLCETTSDC